jgi:hypothetical protein
MRPHRILVTSQRIALGIGLEAAVGMIDHHAPAKLEPPMREPGLNPQPNQRGGYVPLSIVPDLTWLEDLARPASRPVPSRRWTDGPAR